MLVSFQAISAWERGLSIPDLENVVRLAECFGVTVDALLAGVSQELFVGIDGGGSKSEFVLFEKDGTVRNVLRLGGNPYIGIPAIYKKGRPFIASFAVTVVEAAEEGDECALQILRDNAQRLAELIKTAVRRFGTPDEFVAAGGFFKNKLFREMVETAAGIRLTLPEVPPVYGACVEALRGENIPIHENFQKNFMESYRRLSC